jgi:hypothetical protein
MKNRAMIALSFICAKEVKIMPTVSCEICGKKIHKSPSRIRMSKTGVFFCSHTCRGKYFTKPPNLFCDYCGKAFHRSPSNIKENSMTFCSKKCCDDFKRTGCIDWKGYFRFKYNNKVVKLHRAIIEQHIGRKLNPEENVHHINGNKLDNRLSNLKIMTHSEHSKYHREQEKLKSH